MSAKSALTFPPRLTKTRTLWQPSTLIAEARASAHFPKRMFARGFAQDALQEPISAGAKEWSAGSRSHNFPNSRRIFRVAYQRHRRQHHRHPRSEEHTSELQSTMY